jgi:cytochrome b pre-mRNA-processing protein 3
MILRLFRRTSQDDTIAALYGAIVAQARTPEFYRDYSVPDTINGRFENVVLHAVLLLGRLDGGAAADRKLGQGIFDLFCSDMDANMREMGVGDVAVPRKMRSIGEAFYGRKRAYEAALEAPGTEELTSALARNLYGPAAGAVAGAKTMAAYVREAAQRLAEQEFEAVRQGHVAFPDPREFTGPR